MLNFHFVTVLSKLFYSVSIFGVDLHYGRDCINSSKGKGKVFPSVGPRADPGVQAVSPQVTLSHPPGGRLPLQSARFVVTSLEFHQMAPHGSTHAIPAYYSFIDPERTKC